MDYLVNVFLAASTYWAIALVLYAAYWAAGKHQVKIAREAEKFTSEYDQKKAQDTIATIEGVRPKVRVAAILFFVLGVFIGVTSPSNTYKVTVDYNKIQDLQRIQQLNSQPTGAQIQDISRQPQTAEERAAGAIDMRERVNTEQ